LFTKTGYFLLADKPGSTRNEAFDECIGLLAAVELRATCPESRQFVHVDDRAAKRAQSYSWILRRLRGLMRNSRLTR
jgi:hypothetical protein